MIKTIYIHRDIEQILGKLVRQFPAIVVTGPRQSGKSTLLKEIFSKTHSYISLDDPVVRERAISDPRFFLENAGERIIIDEIQYVPQLLSYIKILIDQERHKYGRFIFTGSQQFNMIKNLGDTLAGRIGIAELLPFCVAEKKIAFAAKRKFSSTQEYFAHACLNGSFPEIVVYKNTGVDFWYGAYLKTYLERDVRTIYNIGNLRDFQRFMQLLAARCAQVINLSSLSSELAVGVNTIKRWLSVLEVSRIIYLLPPYYQNLGKRITQNPKIYFLDCGIACYLLSLRNRDYLLKGPMAGPLFENFCFQETVKYIFNRGIKAGLFYVRTHNGLEVDMLIEAGAKLFPIEFKLSKTPNQNMGKQISRFKKLFSKLPVVQGRIISLSEENTPLSRDVYLQSLDNYLSWLKVF